MPGRRSPGDQRRPVLRRRSAEAKHHQTLHGTCIFIPISWGGGLRGQWDGIYDRHGVSGTKTPTLTRSASRTGSARSASWVAARSGGSARRMGGLGGPVGVCPFTTWTDGGLWGIPVSRRSTRRSRPRDSARCVGFLKRWKAAH